MTHYINGESASAEWLRMYEELSGDTQCVEFRAEIEHNDDDEGFVWKQYRTIRMTMTEA